MFITTNLVVFASIIKLVIQYSTINIILFTLQQATCEETELSSFLFSDKYFLHRNGICPNLLPESAVHYKTLLMSHNWKKRWWQERKWEASIHHHHHHYYHPKHMAVLTGSLFVCFFFIFPLSNSTSSTVLQVNI